ncbi:hypothetical protein FORC37_4196 [Vibrio vulnificus]|nr:hypothetical protein FORC37_4196 [Vibrio vulnificus]
MKIGYKKPPFKPTLVLIERENAQSHGGISVKMRLANMTKSERYSRQLFSF